MHERERGRTGTSSGTRYVAPNHIFRAHVWPHVETLCGQRVTAAFIPEPAHDRCHRCDVANDYPASAWDTSTDYGPREEA